MLQLLKKLKLYTKLGPETVHKYSHQNLYVIISRLLAPTKVLLQMENYIEPLIHLENHYQG